MIVEILCVTNIEVETPPRTVRISTYAAMNPHNLESGDGGVCLDLRCPLLARCNQKGIIKESGNNGRFPEMEFHPEDAVDK